MVDVAQTPETPSIDTLLAALDEVDTALRDVYRALAADPDRAEDREARRAELHAKRLRLAQSVGLAVLAQRRAERPVEPEAPVSASGPVQDGAPGPPAIEPVPASADAAPLPERASDADLAQWKDSVRERGLGGGLRLAPSPSTSWPLVLDDLMKAVGHPRDLVATVEAIEEAEALDRVATEEHRELWARLPKHVQQLWLSMLVARTRAVRDCPSATPEVVQRAKVIVGRYPPWAKTYVPGHVNGLQIKHTPLRGSWAQDGRDAWRALCDLLGHELPLESKPVARRRPPQPEPREDDTSDLDPAWHLLPVVRGRKAILVGGDPREPNRDRLERALALASLEWPAVEGPRRVESIAERIRKGSYELVIVLQPFVTHPEAEHVLDAAKAGGTPWALAEGYGVGAVKLALERFLGAARTGTRPQGGVAGPGDPVAAPPLRESAHRRR